MVKAIVEINNDANRILNIVKAKENLKDKSEAINLVLLGVVVLMILLIVGNSFTGFFTKGEKTICMPSGEICDGVDNDCDKLVDEGGVCWEQAEDFFFNLYEEKLTLDQIQKKIIERGAVWIAKETSKSKLSIEEQKKLLGLKVTEEELEKLKDSEATHSKARGFENLPDFFDWRDYHGNDYITPIRDQGGCGSCWAFATIAVLEGHTNAFYNNPNIDLDLSEQDLVSCSGAGNCVYGAPVPHIEGIFSDYFQNTGIATEQCFPYSATDDDCLNKCLDWQDDSWKTLGYQNVLLTIEDIKSALINYGPIEVGMEVYSDFFSYDEGIYSPTSDWRRGVHAVTIVGFGTYDGITYWIVKNSWGESWGEEGYFRIFAGECWIDSWYAFAVTEPNPPEPINKNCEDMDGDNYCYWGLGEKPSIGCPPCDSVIYDCDDLNSSIFEGCGQNSEPTGFLSITSTPTDTEVYVKDLVSGNWFYRGNTPLEIELNVGEREVRISSVGYLSDFITINVEEGVIEDIEIILEKDTSFQEGWPILFPKIIRNSLNVFDLDGILGLELLQASGMSLYVFDYEGNISWSFENDFDDQSISPSIGDIDADGFSEIVGILDSVSLYAFNYNGIILDGFPFNYFSTHSYFHQVAIVSNLNEDDNLEIIAPFAEKYLGDSIWGEAALFVIDYQGEVIWSKIFNGAVLEKIQAMAVGDIDGNGDKEIVAGVYVRGHDDKIYVWNHDGTNFSDDWPKDLGQNFGLRSVSLADIDKDGDLEIFVSSSSLTNGGKMFAYHHNGSVVEGDWPIIIPEYVYGLHAMGDIDGDGKLEIIVGGTNTLHAYHHNGSVVEGDWPISKTGRVGLFAVLGDIDGDFEVEVISSFENELYAFNNNGSVVEGWPKITQAKIMTSPFIADIDEDGDVEVGVSDIDNYIYVWDLDAPYNPETMEWPMFQHDPQHTGCYDCEKTCSDSDGGINYYKYGEGEGYDSLGNPIGFHDTCYEDYWANLVDSCFGEDCWLAEKYCSGKYVETELGINCPNGCQNGACKYLCGDTDGSRGVDIDDVVYLIAYIFTGGPAPVPLEAGDADLSGAIDIDDVVYLIAYIFTGGSAPCNPPKDFQYPDTTGWAEDDVENYLQEAQNPKPVVKVPVKPSKSLS